MFEKISGLINATGWGANSGSAGVQKNKDEYSALSAKLAKYTEAEAKKASSEEQPKEAKVAEEAKNAKVAAESYSSLIEKFNSMKASGDEHLPEFQSVEQQLVKECKKYEAQIQQLKNVINAVESGALELDAETLANNTKRLKNFEAASQSIRNALSGNSVDNEHKADDYDGEQTIEKQNKKIANNPESVNMSSPVKVDSNNGTLLAFNGQPLVNKEVTDADLMNNPKKRAQLLSVYNMQINGIVYELENLNGNDPHSNARAAELNNKLANLQNKIEAIQQVTQAKFENEFTN